MKSAPLDYEPHKVFFQMEKDYNLFAIRTIDGFPLWDIIRYEIWLRIVFINHGSTTSSEKSPIIRFNFSGLSIAVMVVMNFIKFIFFKVDNLYFGFSRVKNLRGERIDPTFESIKNLLDGGVLFYENFAVKGKYTDERRVYNVLPYYKRVVRLLSILRVRSTTTTNFDYCNISSALEETFGREVISVNEIVRIVNEFYVEYYFYKWLLKVWRIKRLFLVNNVQKALLSAARSNGIPIFEFQHGDIVDSTIGLIYGDSKFFGNGGVIFPDVFFSFSSIWTQGKFIPAECIVVGTDFFNHGVTEVKDSRSLTIITSREQNSYLQELTLKLASADSSIRIFYKLHPQQYESLRDQQTYFHAVPNVEVIASEMTMKEVLSYSNYVIAIYSTAIFEALQAGKIVYIFKRLNYYSFQRFFDLPGVYLFDSLEDLLELRATMDFVSLDKGRPIFFQPFNEIVFQNTIAKYSVNL
jgi:hypothetical protein